MSNSIELAKKYVPLLDAKYAVEAKSSILDVDSALVKETINANSILIPKMVLSGLNDYDRNSGFVAGDNTLTWETHTFTQDRGRTFMIDAQDDLETVGIAFGALAGEFIRLHVGPELDAYRFSKLVDKAGNSQDETLTDDTVVSALDAGIATLDDAEAPENDRVVFVSVPTYTLMKQNSAVARKFDVQLGGPKMDRRIEMFDGMPIIKVPTARFKTAYTFTDGFAPDRLATNINFMIVSKSAVIQIVKTAKPRIFTPSVNQTADAYKFDYRIYHDIFVPDNKVNGIYVNKVGSGS